ncbi:fatty-acid amide hydrolase 2-like [Dermacentor silvarum]|uniref:fatty-acid amide hydrolase 2-like n=1 Tax=Dermacentor silvarum TaxID=543639 RepID=UPI002101AFBD|nr:fatty-acid amide hydrolase 2-like [Dermacentor silvarum]
MWGDSQNLVDGCTRNPHDTRRSPGGSSGGEASLLAAAGSLISLGTDIGGSVRIPAAYCGVFGHKPTAGVVPNTGLLPDVGENLEQFNCVGPMARFADDLPLMLNVLAGSATHGLRLNEKVNLKTLKLYYMETEGSVYISRVTTEARRAVRRVTQYLSGAHGLEAHRAAPRDAIGHGYVVQGGRRQGAQAFARDVPARRLQHVSELLRHLVGAGRHTLAALATISMAPLFRFGSKQQAATTWPP